MTAETIQERMIGQVPDYYQYSKIYAAIISTWANEFYTNQVKQDDLVLQLNLQTATWGLRYWEKDYDLVNRVKPEDSYEIRRARVLAKMQGLSTFTKLESLALANAYSRDKTANYEGVFNEYAFKTLHNVDDIIDMNGLRDAFEEMKPAHLEHIIGLIISLYMGPNMTKREYITQLLRETFLTMRKTEKITVTAEIMGQGKYNAYYVNGVKNKPFTLYLNGAFDLNGYYKLDGQNMDGSKLYLRQSETLYVKRIDKATSMVLETWTEVDRPK